MDNKQINEEPQPPAYASLVSETGNLVSLPTVCIKVMELINQPHTTASDLENILCQDPPITAQLLRMANSPYYGLRNKIDTLSRAVSVIGTRRIGNLVLAVSTIKSFNQLSNGIISIENFWSHSIYCGLIANILGSQCKRKQGESLFVAGILHDIGQLIIFNKKPEKTKETLLLMQEDSADNEYCHYEQAVFGFDHMQVGAALAKKWGLPSNLIECIEFHHHPEKAKHFPFEVALIHIANSLANLAELNSTHLDDVPPINKTAWELSGLSKVDIESVINLAQEQFAETQSVLLAA